MEEQAQKQGLMMIVKIIHRIVKDINNEEDKGPPIGENLKTCINAIWQNPLKKYTD